MSVSHQLWSSLIKHNLSPNQLYFLDCCRQKIRPTTIVNQDAERIVCQAKGLITEDNKLTNKALVVLDEFETYLVKTKKKVTSDVLGDNFLDNIKAYREIFPAGFLPSKEPARQSVQELKDKFVWFFKQYPDYTWAEVLEAANFYKYKKSLEDYKYMATSSYFIQKTDNKTKVVKSMLADYCELLRDNPDVVHEVQ